MKNKIVEENLCYGLIDQIEKINKDNTKESELKKKEILKRNFDVSFKNIEQAIKNELNEKIPSQKIQSILNDLEETFNNSRNDLNNVISEVYQENDSTYSIVALLNNKVENLMETVESVENNKDLEQVNEIFMSKMNDMEYNLSAEREYATTVINNSIGASVEDKMMKELEHEIKSTFLKNDVVEQSDLDELEYQISYILNLYLKNQTLDDFYDVDRENIEHIQQKEVNCFKEIKRNCMEVFKKQVDEGLVKNLVNQEEKHDTLGLADLVNSEEQSAVQTNLREEQENTNLQRQDNIVDLPNNAII